MRISIHAPRTGSDTATRDGNAPNLRFQSTLPARGATKAISDAYVAATISIHAPRTGSDYGDSFQRSQPYKFQSTLPARGATERRIDGFNLRDAFQSTLPARGATASRRNPGGLDLISIHAPRTGSDITRRSNQWLRKYFNPRSPHGERPDKVCSYVHLLIFQSTLPARGATGCEMWLEQYLTISIHAPRTGSDPSMWTKTATSENFNPRSPHGERPAPLCDGVAVGGISIHAPRTGSDLIRRRSGEPAGYFNPRSPHGERRRGRARR